MENTVKKVTKRDKLNVLDMLLTTAEEQGFSLPESVTFDDMHTFVTHEIELLDKKTESAKARAETRKVEGDALRDRIAGVLTSEFQTIPEIVAALGDPDVSIQMATHRLTSLAKNGLAEKGDKTIEAQAEGGKSKKLSAYRAMA